ncbi:MAG: hypothetical protein KME06_02650 [Kastovskya adunca ATA6-11-RM4]|jgi:hypothetical protein|nr:hypothetical protein [Kastovskya adunca ATA6-11-RM4]
MPRFATPPNIASRFGGCLASAPLLSVYRQEQIHHLKIGRDSKSGISTETRSRELHKSNLNHITAILPWKDAIAQMSS